MLDGVDEIAALGGLLGSGDGETGGLAALSRLESVGVAEAAGVEEGSAVSVLVVPSLHPLVAAAATEVALIGWEKAVLGAGGGLFCEFLVLGMASTKTLGLGVEAILVAFAPAVPESETVAL